MNKHKVLCKGKGHITFLYRDLQAWRIQTR